MMLPSLFKWVVVFVTFNDGDSQIMKKVENHNLITQPSLHPMPSFCSSSKAHPFNAPSPMLKAGTGASCHGFKATDKNILNKNLKKIKSPKHMFVAISNRDNFSLEAQSTHFLTCHSREEKSEIF